MTSKPTKLIYSSLVYLFLYFPIAIVIIYSFNNAHYSLLWHGFTLKWYQQLIHDKSLLIVALHSLSIAILASTGACVIGLATAIGFYRYQFYAKKLMQTLIFIMITLPNIVLAIAYLLLYKSLHIPLGFYSLLLAHISFCMPFVAIIVYSTLLDLDKNIFEAAQDLGASDLTIIRKVVIPLLWPALLAGWLISFTLSIDDVIISYFVTGPSFDVLPLKIYSMVRIGIKPEINALCTILFVVTLLLIVLAQFLHNKKQRIRVSK